MCRGSGPCVSTLPMSRRMSDAALRIALTGASGYIGRRLLSRLNAETGVESVLAIDIRPPPPGASWENVRFVEHDVSDPFPQVLSRHGIDAAVHLAYVMRPGRDREAARRVNVGGTRNLLEACAAADVKRLVYLSSTTVYGAHEDNPEMLTEDADPRPLKGYQYSEDKVASELLFGDFAGERPGTAISILRGCPVLGPGADNYVAEALRRPFLVAFKGDGPPMQFLHEDDLAEVIVRWLLGGAPGVYNVAGDGAVDWREAAGILKRPLFTLPAPLLYGVTAAAWALRLQSDSPAAGLDLIRYRWTASTEKIKQELGITFRSSREALEEFAHRWV